MEGIAPVPLLASEYHWLLVSSDKCLSRSAVSYDETLSHVVFRPGGGDSGVGHIGRELHEVTCERRAGPPRQ